MKKASQLILLLSAVGLAACSTTAPAPLAQAEKVEPLLQITQYADPAVNEAAGAYVSLYKETIEKSLQESRYIGDLAYRHLSAEACFESRANRLLDRELSAQEKEALVLSHVAAEKLERYKALAVGYFPRINGLELFTCDRAGLRVAHNTVKH